MILSKNDSTQPDIEPLVKNQDPSQEDTIQ